MNYEGPVWRVDYLKGGNMYSTVVLVANMDEAQDAARKSLPDAQLVGFYQISGVRGAIYK